MNKAQEIKLYGDIGTWKNNGVTFTQQLSDIENTGCKDLTIRMHCYGGSVFEGNVMFNALRRSKMNIKIVVDGIAASMASILLLAVKDVEIAENGFIMVHSPSGYTEGSAKDHEQTAKLLRDLERNFSIQYAGISGLGVEQVKSQWLDGFDHWLNADEAIKYKFASRKIPSSAKGVESLDKEAVLSMNIKSVYSRYTAILTNQNESEMKKELIDVFELQGVTPESPDSEVMQLLKDKFAELEQQVSQGNAEGETAKASTISTMLDNAQREGKITDELRSTYEMVGKTSGIDALSSILSGIVKRPSILSLIKNEAKGQVSSDLQPKSKKDWTLEDYRMYAPKELRDNNKLYDQLIEKQYGKE
jgi:ATP-dependent Clp protease protease subunit